MLLVFRSVMSVLHKMSVPLYSLLWLSVFLLEAESICPPLESDTVNFFCLVDGDDIGNCSEPSLPDTKARFECKPGFYLKTDPAFWFITCQLTGVWDKTPFECLQECGLRQVWQEPLVQPLVKNQQRKPNDFPWHVAIYDKKGEHFDQICGGTLITPSVVISAAHCFYDQVRGKRDPALFKVVAGKFFRRWEEVEEQSQSRDAWNITLPLVFRGRERNFRDDIAVVRLTTPMDLTDDVNIACVAWYNEGMHADMKPERNGTVPGWRFDIAVPHIQSVDLPFIPAETCEDALSEEVRPLYTPDKFCAGYVGRNISVCPGDSGSGIVFLEADTGRFFMRGIVSISFKPSAVRGDVCYRDSYTAFTSFAEHRHWVQGLL